MRKLKISEFVVFKSPLCGNPEFIVDLLYQVFSQGVSWNDDSWLCRG